MPFRPARWVPLVLAAALAVSTLAGPADATSYDAGLSTPREDSYYPDHGDPGVDTLHYGLDLTWLRARRTLSGVADIRLRATAAAPSFQLDLADSLVVSRVTVDGEPAASSHAGDVLRVDVPVVADERYDVRVVYRGTPRPAHAPTTRDDFDTIGMNVTRDGQLWTMQEPYGAFTWYPVNDHPSDKALYDVRVTVPRPWVGVSNGRLVSQRRTAKQTITRFHLAHPAASYLTTLAVGPYAHRTATGPHGLPLSYWLPAGSVGRYLEALRHVPADLRWLERRLGRYPFESAGVVVVPGASAMETQTMITFGRNTWGRPLDAREVMVHELAHQWWGDTVTPSDWRDLWMNEGMAMYLQSRWAAEHTDMSWPQQVDMFRVFNWMAREEQGGPGAYDPEMFATDCVYLCTAMMYETLRKKVGSRDFWRIVRQWPQRQPDANVDRAGFERYAERVTGDELTGFFTRWLNRASWPQAPEWPPA
jgi:aminopeptidase N